LQRHGQTRFTFIQGQAGDVQLLTTLRHTVLQADLGFAQLLFDLTALLDFTHQILIQLFAALLRLLEMLDQRLVLETPQEFTLDQAVDLPGHQVQRHQQDQAEHTPTLLLRATIP